ncbi:unnamed protein product [Prorocentrum cordatum]|uniref:Uncharacterized protein n=1 Tax=Prorocentrum cordatum TaxID=2364126 RepID=A0ABN9VNC6_9DINO|nr:unnamed protein product [Polarella glacialis]
MSSLTCLLQRGPAQAARSMGGAERNRHARWATERLEDYRDRGERSLVKHAPVRRGGLRRVWSPPGRGRGEQKVPILSLHGPLQGCQ